MQAFYFRSSPRFIEVQEYFRAKRSIRSISAAPICKSREFRGFKKFSAVSFNLLESTIFSLISVSSSSSFVISDCLALICCLMRSLAGLGAFLPSSAYFSASASIWRCLLFFSACTLSHCNFARYD